MKLRGIPGDRNAFFLDASSSAKELWQALDYLWEVSMQRHNVELTVTCAWIRIHLNGTYTDGQLKKLAAMHAEALAELATREQRPDAEIEIRL